MEPVVRKEYHEDLGTKDEEGYYDFAYRYWIYWFDGFEPTITSE